MLQEEASLRPRVDAIAAARTPPSRTLRAASVSVVVAAVVAWALLLQQQQLVLARASRPPKLRGPEVGTYAEFMSTGGLLLAWQNIAAALGCGFALGLVFSLLPSTRAFAMRWTWVPVAIGAAAWLGARWYLLVMGL